MIDKKVFRSSCLEVLQKASLRTYQGDKRVITEIYDLIRRHKVKRVMLYIPMKIEVDISALMLQLRREGKQLYVPFMEGDSFRLVKYRLPLQRKRFGIKEPKFSRQYQNCSIDLAIVPIVGLDRTCRRIGFGKGMYDRFFEKHGDRVREKLFVARRLCYTQVCVTDHYDSVADHIIVGK